MVICGEPDDIPPQDHVLRRVKHDLQYLEYDSDNAVWRPASTNHALQFDRRPDWSPVAREMSTSWREHIESAVHHGHPSDVADPANGYTLVYQARAESIRSIPVREDPNHSLEVYHTPNSPAFADCAHSSVVIPSSSTKADRELIRMAVASEMDLVVGDVKFPPPPQ
jgi:hypothetical protein